MIFRKNLKKQFSRLIGILNTTYNKVFIFIWGDRFTHLEELFDHDAISNYCKQFVTSSNKPRVFEGTFSTKQYGPVYSIGHCKPEAALDNTTRWDIDYSVLVPDCSLYYKDNIFIANNRYFLNKLSHFPASEPGIHFALHRKYFGCTIILQGKSLVIRAGVWFHFIYEGLPALYKAELAGHPLSSFDHFVLVGPVPVAALKLLEFCGINTSRIHQLNDEKKGVRCEELFISDYYFNAEVNFRNFFHSLRSKIPVPVRRFSKYIYISRAKAKYRRVLNEDGLITFLTAYGFEIVYNEELTIEEQVACFKNAEIIIAPHGANLANIVFCKPGAKIIEIRYAGHSMHKASYWNMAVIMQLQYAIVYCQNGEKIKDQIFKSDRDWDNANMYVSVEDLKQMLKSFCSLNI